MKLKVSLSYVRVVVIAVALGLLAKMTAPESTQASIANNTTELIGILIEVRSSLDLYRAEHDGQLPPTRSFAGFDEALTQEAGHCGPYMKEIPRNPFNGLNTVRFDGEPAGANTAGWRLDTQTGAFKADNDSAYAAL